MDVNLVETKLKIFIAAEISRVKDEDFSLITQSREYIFDWRLERYNDVYKIVLKSDESKILGLMSLEDYPNEKRLHLNLLEKGDSNRGEKKRIDNIVGCLIAYAARISFKKGYNGIVTIDPKNALFDHYHRSYGFIEIGYMMIIRAQQSSLLIEKYLKNG